MKINKKLQVIIPLLFFFFILLFVGVKWLTITNDSNQSLRNDIKVLMYIKAGCKYCLMAKTLLLEHHIGFESIDISFDPDIQKKLFEQTGQNTVPYIFIDDKFIGGYSNLLELANNKKL